MKTLSDYIIKIEEIKEARDFLVSMFTSEEIEELNTRLKIIELLLKKVSQREIASKLKVGIATVSRGASELKKGHFKFMKDSNEKQNK